MPASLPDAIENPKRICIIGAGSTGKSTLAYKLGKKFNLPVTHLDAIHHEPTGNWIARPPEDYLRDHDAVIAQDKWVIEGNYTMSMPQRFARADLIIETKTPNRFVTLYRFIKRHIETNWNLKERHGMPANIDNRFKWEMVRMILGLSLPNAEKHTRAAKKQAIKKQLRQEHGHKFVTLRSFKENDRFLEML